MKRLKKILKWTGIVLGGLVAIGLVANAVFVWTTDTRLERQLAAIREAGDPLSIAELARKPISPEKNAATYLRRAEADSNAIQQELLVNRDVLKDSERLMPPEDQKAVEATLAAYPNVIPLLEQAAACPDYDAQFDYTLPPMEFMQQLLDSVQKRREANRVLWIRAHLLVAEGRRDEAVRTALANFRLARHFDRNPVLISYFVTLACRVPAFESANEALQTGSVSKEVRDALDAELALQEPLDGYAWAITSERAYGIDSFRTFPGRNFWLLMRGLQNRWESEYLNEMQAFLTLTHDPGPYREAEKIIHKIAASISQGGEGTLAQLEEPVIHALHHAVTRTRAMIRCLRVLNALQARAPAESSQTPKLTELGLPAATTADPFTGEPLHVKKTPQGWLVYSVGRNFQDDGGKFEDMLDIGVGPPPPVAKPAKNDRAVKAGKRE